MGKKAEAGTPKVGDIVPLLLIAPLTLLLWQAIANASKAKGLQRLRFFCQVCQKQCRDENAFKQHSLSEAHVRQMLVVGEHAHKYIDDFSTTFQSDFLALLSRRWGTKRIEANRVYNEFIQDKHHSHMNATRWVTLSAFVQHLGKSGICHVDQTEKGWHIAWIDNSPNALKRQAEGMKKERQDMDDEQRERKLLNEQIERARRLEEEKRQNGEDAEEEEANVDIASLQPIKMTIGGASGKGKEKEVEIPPVSSLDTAAEEEAKPSNASLEASVSITDAAESSASTSTATQSVADGTTTISTTLPSPSVTSLPPSKPTTKINPLKAMGTSKPNPLKGNALKSNPLKGSSNKKDRSVEEASSGGGQQKRPLSNVEMIIQEEIERKKRRENSTWSGERGHGREGLQQRR